MIRMLKKLIRFSIHVGLKAASYLKGVASVGVIAMTRAN